MSELARQDAVFKIELTWNDGAHGFRLPLAVQLSGSTCFLSSAYGLFRINV